MDKNKKILPLQDIPGTLGQRLRLLRKNRSFSQEKLAEIIGYKGAVSVSKIEKDTMSPSINVLAKIAETLDADLHWLITGQPAPSQTALSAAYREAGRRLIPFAIEYMNVLLSQEKDLKKEKQRLQQKASDDPGTQIRIVQINTRLESLDKRFKESALEFHEAVEVLKSKNEHAYFGFGWCDEDKTKVEK